MIEKTYLDANGYLRDMWRLAAAVAQSGWKADVLVSLWRGGAPVGVAVHEFLKNLCGWNPRQEVLKCSSYSGLGESTAVSFDGAGAFLAGISASEKVLVVDDVFDTGKTAEAVKNLIDGTGAEMKFASVYFKPGKNRTQLVPDFFVRDVGDEWIVFPHEIEGLARGEIAGKDPVLADLAEAVCGRA
jgi:hypoxanthine phosphoribosyltransferase